MKGKIQSLLNRTKKKAAIVAVCAAIIATVGSGAVFAADASSANTGRTSVDYRNTSSTNDQAGKIANEKSNVYKEPKGDNVVIRAKVENGVTYYSTDSGNTWSQNIPQGAVKEKSNPNFSAKEGNVYKEPKGDNVVIRTKVENGVKYYSTDGGNTWRQNAPDGAVKKGN